MIQYISVTKLATAETYTVIRCGSEMWKISIKPRFTNRLQSRNGGDITKEYNINTVKKRQASKNGGKK